MGDKLRILLVEDVDMTVMLTTALLESIDSKLVIDVAENGKQALDLANKNKYSLILMDIGLPDIDGLAVSETIRKTKKCINATTPIIVLTGNDFTDYKKRAKKIDIEEFLLKPLEEDVAVKLLNDYVYSKK
jgi:two-component system, sensor histidine kinase and response regulator